MYFSSIKEADTALGGTARVTAINVVCPPMSRMMGQVHEMSTQDANPIMIRRRKISIFCELNQSILKRFDMSEI
jgi:hypothetical protein